MTTLETNAFASVPRIAGALVDISKALKAIALVEYANTIDCTGLDGRIQHANMIKKVCENLGIAAE